MHDEKGVAPAADRYDAVMPGALASTIAFQQGAQLLFARRPVQPVFFLMNAAARADAFGIEADAEGVVLGVKAAAAEFHFAFFSTLRMGSMRQIRSSSGVVSSAGSCSQIGSFSFQTPSLPWRHILPR